MTSRISNLKFQQSHNAEFAEKFICVLASSRKTKPLYNEVLSVKHLSNIDVLRLVYYRGRFRNANETVKFLEKTKADANNLHSHNFLANWEKVRILESYLKCVEVFAGKNEQTVTNKKISNRLQKEIAD